MALGLIGLAATGCADQAAAARVGDQTLSEADFLDELQAFAGNDQYVEAYTQSTGQSPDALRGESPDSFSQVFAGSILEQRVVFMLVTELFDDEGLELTDTDRDTTRQQIIQDQQSIGLFYGGFSASYQDQVVDDYTRVFTLQEAMGQEEFSAALREVAESTDIQLNSRYGTFDVDALLSEQPAITPPAGPAAAPEDEGGADGGDEAEPSAEQ